MRLGDDITPESIGKAVTTNLPLDALPIAAGCAAFASSLALSTFIQLKCLRVSTASLRPVPSVLGFVSVALSSLASHSASVQVHNFLSKHNNPHQRQSSSYAPTTIATSFLPLRPTERIQLGPLQVDKHTLRICVLGLVSFKLLGGRFWAVAPSSYTHLGSFARIGIPATEGYASPSQRRMVERLGSWWVGCHTCGSHMILRSSPKFHGDHQPPKVLAQQMNRKWFRQKFGRQVKFQFYPQCRDCSNIQGGLLSSVNKNNSQHLAKFHGLRPRFNHLTGGVIAAVTVGHASDTDIDNDGNRRRFRDIHERIEDAARDVYAYCKSLLS